MVQTSGPSDTPEVDIPVMLWIAIKKFTDEMEALTARHGGWTPTECVAYDHAVGQLLGFHFTYSWEAVDVPMYTKTLMELTHGK